MGRHATALAIGALLAGGAACFVDIPPVAGTDDGGRIDGSGVGVSAIDGGPTDAVYEQTQTDGCTGTRSCIPAAPAGWTGPFAFDEAAPGTLPSCPSTLKQTLSGHENLTAPSAVCAACTCSLVGATCTSASASVFEDANCFLKQTSAPVTTTVCKTLTASSVRSSLTVTPANATASSCTSGGGKATLPAASWGSDVLGCAPAGLTQVDCPSNELCADAPPAPFESRACISSSGDVSCPATGYTQKRVVYSSMADKRSCTSCACGLPASAPCTGNATLEVFSDSACATMADSYQADGVCESKKGGGSDSIGSIRLAGVSVPSTFDCTTSGGQPTGSATSTGPTTVCCLP